MRTHSCACVRVCPLLRCRNSTLARLTLCLFRRCCCFYLPLTSFFLLSFHPPPLSLSPRLELLDQECRKLSRTATDDLSEPGSIRGEPRLLNIDTIIHPCAADDDDVLASFAPRRRGPQQPRLHSSKVRAGDGIARTPVQQQSHLGQPYLPPRERKKEREKQKPAVLASKQRGRFRRSCRRQCSSAPRRLFERC